MSIGPWFASTDAFFGTAKVWKSVEIWYSKSSHTRSRLSIVKLMEVDSAEPTDSEFSTIIEKSSLETGEPELGKSSHHMDTLLCHRELLMSTPKLAVVVSVTVVVLVSSVVLVSTVVLVSLGGGPFNILPPKPESSELFYSFEFVL